MYDRGAGAGCGGAGDGEDDAPDAADRAHIEDNGHAS